MPRRRDILTGLAAIALLPNQGWAAVGSPVAISAAMRADGRHVLVGLNENGNLTFEVPLPDRGHAAAAHPFVAEVVATARRPGTFAVVIDCAAGQIKRQLFAPKGRHFYGHATFSADGKYLFTTENAYGTGEGRIGVWDRAQGFARIDEFSSGGIGPHEIILLPNGDLAVANGGIRTHPASGREKLNLDKMQSNLSVLSIYGSVKDQALVPASIHLNSLRHIAALPDGTIGCACQWQGDLYNTPALVAFYRGQGRLSFVEMDEQLLLSLQGYIGSIACMELDTFVLTSPRGNKSIVLGANEEVRFELNAYDVCGVAASPHGRVFLTTGLGKVFELQRKASLQIAQHSLAFDNHILALTVGD